MPCTLHAERSRPLISQMEYKPIIAGTGASKQNSIQSWREAKGKQQSGSKVNYTQSLKRNCQRNQTTFQKQENKNWKKMEMKARSPKSVLQSVLGASEVWVYRTWEGKSAFNFQAAKAVDCSKIEKLHPDSRDFGYCFSLPFLSGAPLESPRCSRGVCARCKSWGHSPFLPLGSYHPFFLHLPFQDFTSSQSWSVESSTSDSPTSIAIISEMSESLLTAGSCSLLVV